MLRSKVSPPRSVTSRHSSNTNKPTDLPHVEVLQNSSKAKCSNGYQMPTANHYWQVSIENTSSRVPRTNITHIACVMELDWECSQSFGPQSHAQATVEKGKHSLPPPLPRLLAASNLLCNQKYHTLLWSDTIRPQSGYVWGKEWRIKGTVCKGGVSGDRLSERWLGRPKEHFLANITPTSSDIRAISDIERSPF